MTLEKFDLLKQRLENYCDVNAFDLIALKANLDAPDNTALRATFQSELTDAIAGGLPQATYEDITGDEFEDTDSYIAYLTAIAAFLFADGPHP